MFDISIETIFNLPHPDDVAPAKDEVLLSPRKEQWETLRLQAHIASEIAATFSDDFFSLKEVVTLQEPQPAGDP